MGNLEGLKGGREMEDEEEEEGLRSLSTFLIPSHLYGA